MSSANCSRRFSPYFFVTVVASSPRIHCFLLMSAIAALHLATAARYSASSISVGAIVSVVCALLSLHLLLQILARLALRLALSHQRSVESPARECTYSWAGAIWPPLLHACAGTLAPIPGINRYGQSSRQGRQKGAEMDRHDGVGREARLPSVQHSKASENEAKLPAASKVVRKQESLARGCD